MELHRAVSHTGTGGWLARIFQKPLFRETRLDRHIGAFAEADVVLVILHLHQRAKFLKLGRSLLAGLETILPDQVCTGKVVHPAVSF